MLKHVPLHVSRSKNLAQDTCNVPVMMVTAAPRQTVSSLQCRDTRLTTGRMFAGGHWRESSSRPDGEPGTREPIETAPSMQPITMVHGDRVRFCDHSPRLASPPFRRLPASTYNALSINSWRPTTHFSVWMVASCAVPARYDK